LFYYNADELPIHENAKAKEANRKMRKKERPDPYSQKNSEFSGALKAILALLRGRFGQLAGILMFSGDYRCQTVK
jgi:hypothetical protein